MLYNLVDERELIVTLSAVEICDYFGSFEELRYDNKDAKAALGSILRQAIYKTDFNLSGERLYIKVHPNLDGGCTICFSVSRRKKRILRPVSHTYIYEFIGCEHLLLMCEQIKKHSRSDTVVSVYRNGDTYRLLMRQEDINRQILAFGPEYCDCIYKNAVETEKTKEHWQKVCANAPINRIINF